MYDIELKENKTLNVYNKKLNKLFITFTYFSSKTYVTIDGCYP